MKTPRQTPALSLLAALFLIASAAFASACSSDGSPGSTGLAGTWTTNVTSGGVTLAVSVDLQSGGGVIFSETYGGSCSGSFTFTGSSWSATSTLITLSGTPTCAGSGSCSEFGQTTSLTCANETAPFNGTVGYSPSSDGSTLTLSGGEDGGTQTLVLTRS